MSDYYSAMNDDLDRVLSKFWRDDFKLSAVLSTDTGACMNHQRVRLQRCYRGRLSADAADSALLGGTIRIT